MMPEARGRSIRNIGRHPVASHIYVRPKLSRGAIIKRLGASLVTAIGILLIIACAIISLMGPASHISPRR